MLIVFSLIPKGLVLIFIVDGTALHCPEIYPAALKPVDAMKT